MAVPIPSGTLTWNETDYPFAQCVATIEVGLEFVPRTPGAAAAGKQELRVRSGGAAMEAGAKPVVVDQLSFPEGHEPNPIVPPFLRDLLELWFAEHIGEFNHVFSVVSLGDRADEDALQWVKPTAVGYAYVQPGPTAPDEDCILAVLAMTEGRSAVPLPQQVSPFAILPGARAGFVIGGGRYLDRVMRPALAGLFQGATVDDFEVRGLTLTNTRNLTMRPIKKNYTPSVGAGKFTAELQQDRLEVCVRSAHINVSPGIDLYLDYTLYAGAKLLTRSDGTQALHLYDVLPLDYHHEVEVASWVVVTEIVAGLIAGVVLAGVGNVAGKAAANALKEAGKVAEDSFTYQLVKWVITGVLTCIGGGVGTISTIIEANANANADDLDAFDPFAKEATASIEWPGSTGMTLQGVAFNGGMQIGIDPVFLD
jgi:hypothetical protein